MPVPTAPPPTKRYPIRPGMDRRSAPRYRLRRVLVVRFLARPSFQAHRAVVHDVSLTGLALAVVRLFEPGTVLAIELKGKQCGISAILTARVQRAAPLPDGNWRLGCRLSRPLSEEELSTLL